MEYLQVCKSKLVLEKSPARRRDKERRRDRSRSRSRSRFDERPWLSANDFQRSSLGPSGSRRSRSSERSPIRDDNQYTKREEPSIMKQLLQALVNASTNRDNPDAIRLSTALTNAILKAKAQQQPQTRPLTTFSIKNSYSVPKNTGGYGIPMSTAYSKPPTKPKLGSSYYR
uniref:Uncharacterized protein n=1 Tax=Romanomermis culicivorax TaxID=13658 RepID=A0A915L959_ROMCU